MSENVLMEEFLLRHELFSKSAQLCVIQVSVEHSTYQAWRPQTTPTSNDKTL